jgi:hypothetical protein
MTGVAKRSRGVTQVEDRGGGRRPADRHRAAAPAGAGRVSHAPGSAGASTGRRREPWPTGQPGRRRTRRGLGAAAR